MEQETGRLRVNVKAFLEDWVRGLSEEELLEKHRLTNSQLTRVVGVLRKQHRITEGEIAERTENLKIRFGSTEGPPEQTVYRKGEVELDTGLVLHCPSCGAAVKRGAENCEYCGAYLDFALKGKTVHCPVCFATTPANSRFCMRCARPIKGLVEEGKLLEDRLCPRCRVPMRGRTFGKFSVAQCSECSGVFVPHETFEMMQESRDRVIFPARPIERGEVQTDAYVRYVRCPICRNMMNRTNFARISGVIIDTCRGHGIWFDPGELERIMEFVSVGGLAKAKEVDLRRQKDEEQLMRLRNIPITQERVSPYASTGFGGYDEVRAGIDLVDVVSRVFGFLRRT